MIGDLQTAALIGRDGSIDWCCFPRFDSGACFARLLGDADHGRWLLAPAGGITSATRRYRSDTLILESIYECAEGRVRAIDFMPPRGDTPDIVRIVESLDGEVPMRSELVIRFDYGSIVPWVRRVDHARVAIAGPDALCFHSETPVRGENMTTVSEFVLKPGRRVPFVLTWFPSHQPLPDPIDAESALNDSEAYWLEWAGNCRHTGDYHDEIHSSLLVLKALTYRPTGGIVAAPTTSLARADRRPAQLGLPLLLAARRHAHAARDARRRLPRGGARLARLAAARDRGRSGRPPDHVRHRRRAAAGRARARLAARLRRLAAGARRQRRIHPATAGRVRRVDGLRLPDACSRRPWRSGRVVVAPDAAAVAGGRLAPGGRRHLGSARPQPPLHLLQGDVVGGLRPGGAISR